MEQIILDGRSFRGDQIPLISSSILVLQGQKGMLGCGYLAVETADKLGHALAVVTGVASFDDMLKAKVARVSSKAAEYGVAIGMTGREALLMMER